MRRILYYVIGTGLVFYGWHGIRQARLGAEDETVSAPAPAALTVERPDVDPGYRCDGRQRCTEMHSCEEATWFIRHCAGTKMDGDGDGIPCETEWCPR